MFDVGHKVVYPMHGAGIIERIEKQELMGQEQEYYIVSLQNNEMQVMIPVERACELGLRGIHTREVYQRVFHVLEGDARELSDNWNHRYRANMDKLKTGNIEDTAEVIKDLFLRDQTRGLSTGEKKMLDNALEILASELSLAVDVSCKEARSRILSCMS